jgi:hypothetical protein
MAQRLFKRLRELLDVDFSTFQDGDRVVYQASSDKFVGMASAGGSSSADDITFTPAGSIAATDVQAAIQELDSEKAATSHVHDGADITTGTVADARIASTIARDSEVTAAVAAEATSRDAAIATHEADTTNVHGIADTSALDTVSARNSAISTSEAGQVRDGDAAGGVLAGTYPSPSFAVDMATQAELDAAVATLQPIDSDLTAIAALATTSYGRALLALADAAALRTAAGLVIGTDVQAFDSDLAAFAGLAIAADKLPYGSGSHTLALADFTAAARALLDDADASTMLSTLGLSTFIKTLVDDADAATARATLGVIASLFQSGGAQAIKLDDLAAPDDNTDLNASSSAHGLLPKLPNDATKFLDGTGAFSTPAAEDVIAGIFGTPDTAFEFSTSSLTGLTTIGSPDTEDANTTVPGHYFISDNDNTGVGTYVAASPPFTVITKLSDRTLVNVDGCKSGLFVGDSSPSLGSDCNGILHGNSNGNVWAEVIATSNITNTFGGTPPIYFAIRVNSTTDVDMLFSNNGRVWYKIVDSRNPSITIATCGLYIYSAGSNLQSAAFDFLRIWNSAKSFPGAVA